MVLLPVRVEVRHQEGLSLNLGDVTEEERPGQKTKLLFSGGRWGRRVREEPEAGSQLLLLPPAGTLGEALRLGALRLLLFKLLLFDLLLTCSRLRARTAARGHRPGETRPPDPGFSAPALGPQPRPLAQPCARTEGSRRIERGITGQGQPRAGCGVHTHPPGPGADPSRTPAWEEGPLSTHAAWAWGSGPALVPASRSPELPGGGAASTFRPRPFWETPLRVSHQTGGPLRVVPDPGAGTCEVHVTEDY